MSEKGKINNTAEKIEEVATESAQQKQTGNTRALLLQNMPGAREFRSVIGSTLGLIETTADTLFRVISLAGRPQDIKYAGKIIRNGIKATIAEAPQVPTTGVKEYIQNLRAPKLTRDGLKQYHDPYLDATKFFDTHGTERSIAPQKNDHWFKKVIKGIPFIAGKAVKIPAWGISTLIATVGDSARRMKAQKMRDLITFNFQKTSRNKTKYAWRKLTSWAYTGTSSNNSTTVESDKDSTKKTSDSASGGEKKKSRRSRWPFGKKKAEEKKEENTKATEKTKEANIDKDKKKTDEKPASKASKEKEETTGQHKNDVEDSKTAGAIKPNETKKAEETKKTDDKAKSQIESNNAMRDYINQEQQRLTKRHNDKEKIEVDDIGKWLKSIQSYTASGGEVVFTGQAKADGSISNGKLTSLIVEDNKVKAVYIDDKTGKEAKDEIDLNNVFSPDFSFHLPGGTGNKKDDKKTDTSTKENKKDENKKDEKTNDKDTASEKNTINEKATEKKPEVGKVPTNNKPEAGSSDNPGVEKKDKDISTTPPKDKKTI